MLKIRINRVYVLVCVAAIVVGSAPLADAQTGLERKVLLQQDLTIPGHEAALVSVTIAVGGREGKHTHPGTLVAQVLEGELTLEKEGRPTATYKVGDSFVVEPGQVHEGINRGKLPIKLLATFIVEKGKPLASPVR